MSVLKIATVKARLLLTAIAALSSVACGGADERPAYAASDVAVDETPVAGQPLQCENGAIKTCTIWLGQHGDLNNCVKGLDVCSDGAWTGCVDEASLSDDPELYSQLAGDDSAEIETP
jgi:hypothetical protein